MNNRKYAIGVDFGTESGRAVLVDVADGREVATAVYPYANAVIDERLPLDGEKVILEPDWALQDPEDYIRTFQNAIPGVMKQSGVGAADVIGIGIDFTACTMLPTTKDGMPLCLLPELRRSPHAWVKLWKHHAAQPEADRINVTARRMQQGWLDRYGGKISSEWFFSKVLQILDEAPEVYARADRMIEAADWVVWQLTGAETRNSCTAGYKAIWSKREGFPKKEYFAALDPRLADVSDADLQKQFQLAIQIRDETARAHEAIIQIRSIKDRLSQRMRASKDAEALRLASAIRSKLDEVEQDLYQTKNRSPRDTLNYPIKLNNQLAVLQNLVDMGDNPPTDQDYAVFEELKVRLHQILARLDRVNADDLTQFNQRMAAEKLDPVKPK